MRTWNLKSEDPYSITLAADARFGETNYLDDQIWEFSYSSGDPSALAVYTTYGLRAKSMRLFPRFTIGNKSVINPDEFDSKLEINIVLPNYLKISFSPFRDIDVIAEYWVPGSNSIVGKLSLANRGDALQVVQVDWIAQLAPNDGQPMTPVSIEAAPVLAGKTQMLHPVIFITAGPQPGKGSYPSLFRTYSLEPGDNGEFSWIHCAKNSIEDSFSRAREIANLNFRAEIAALEMKNSSIIDIYTGEPDWDAVFVFSQLK